MGSTPPLTPPSAGGHRRNRALVLRKAVSVCSSNGDVSDREKSEKDGARKHTPTRPIRLRHDKRSSCCSCNRCVIGLLVLFLFAGSAWVAFRIVWWEYWASGCIEGCYEKGSTTGADGPEQVRIGSGRYFSFYRCEYIFSLSACLVDVTSRACPCASVCPRLNA